MYFADSFENKRINYGIYREQTYHDDVRYSYDLHHSYSGFSDHQKWMKTLEMIRRNSKLKLLVLLVGILLFTIAIVLIILLLPLFTKLYN